MIKKVSADDVAILEALPGKYYAQGHLPGALNLPHDAPDEDIYSALKDKDAEIITYCANGPCLNSEILAERLVKMGFSNVSDFHSGKEGWVKSGRHLVK